MRKIFKRIFMTAISFALTLLTVVAGVNPATISVSANESVAAYEQTNVLDDLRGSTINGKAFSISDYGFNSFEETKVISFVEYCYSFYKNLQDNYGLYVYVYNPKGMRFVVDHELNQIQFSYGLNADTSYKKYQLAYLNSSTEAGCEGLFYKFKVILTPAQKQELLANLNENDRAYKVSGLELLESGKTNATEYSVATTYHYSGYALGYGSNPSTENSLSCRSEQGETLTLNVHSTTYRPEGSNGKNNYTQDSLHSVYFAVPNEMIKRYGSMSAVHAIWKNAVLKPVLVTGNKEAYNAILPYLGEELTGSEIAAGAYEAGELDYMYLGAYHEGPTVFGSTSHTFDYSYNCLADMFYQDGMEESYSRLLDGIGENINPLYMMFYAGDGTDSADNYMVSSGDILEELKGSKSKFDGALVNGKYSRSVFESVDSKYTEVNIRASEQYSLTSEKITSSWWEKIWGKSHVESSTTFDGISAIYAVRDSDMSGGAKDICQRLYVSESDYQDFRDYYNANKSLCSIYLFRYQVSDYVSQEASLMKYEKESWLSIDETWVKQDSNAYFFQETVNLDFDIIDVTFTNGSVDTVIPVVSDPIDIVPDATPPIYTESDEEAEWIRWMKIGLALLLIVILGFIFWPILKPLLSIIGKAVVWVMSLPLRLIDKLFGGEDKDNKE